MMSNALTNREIAALIWLSLGLLLSLRSSRQSLLDVVRAFAKPKMLVPFLTFTGWVACLVFGGWLLGIWTVSMTKHTALWFLGPAIVLFFNIDRASSHQNFFRRTALSTIKVSAILAVLINYFSMHLIVELLLFPTLFMLTAMATLARTREEWKSIEQFSNAIVGVIVIVLSAFAAYRFISDWSTLNFTAIGWALFLPSWLTVGVLPFTYIMALVIAYESAFIRVNIMSKDPRARRRAKFALLLGLHVKLRSIGNVQLHHARDATHTESLRAAFKVVRSSLRAQPDRAPSAPRWLKTFSRPSGRRTAEPTSHAPHCSYRNTPPEGTSVTPDHPPGRRWQYGGKSSWRSPTTKP